MPFLSSEKIKGILDRYRPHGWRVLESKKRTCTAEANFNKKLICVPRVTTRWRLWAYLHECGHVHLRHQHHDLHPHVEEYEACLYAFSIMKAEGVASTRTLRISARRYVREHIRRDKKKGLQIVSYVKRWAYRGEK